MMNPKMAAILGTDTPPPVEHDEVVGEIIPVMPHELVDVSNGDLPPMHDVDRKQLQAEKQLEEVIEHALGYQRELFAEVGEVDPKYRSRYIEVANGTMGLALDAIKVKIKTQEVRRKQRLEEAEFVRPNQSGSDPSVSNNFFIGTREEVIAMVRDAETSDDT